MDCIPMALPNVFLVISHSIPVVDCVTHCHTCTGKTLVLHHYRHSDSCEGEEELPPIDVNLNYDVDYQV